MSCLNILLVDDRTENLNFLTDYLIHHGHRIACSTSGITALEVMKRQLPDVCLLDLEMPGMDGREVLSRMKADPQLARVPVVIVSAHAAQDIEEECLEAGAIGVMSKPLGLKKVLEFLRQFQPLE